jgi:hypothetical protein
MKCGNLNFLEPSGPLQACNGTALPFYIPEIETAEPQTAILAYFQRKNPIIRIFCISGWFAVSIIPD